MNTGQAAKIVAHERVSQIIQHENDGLRDILPPRPIDPGAGDPYNRLVAEAREVLRKAESG